MSEGDVLNDEGGWTAGLRPESDYSDEELRAFAEFTEAQVAGHNPDLEQHLARYPQYAAQLRPVLESAVWFYREVREFKQEFPDFSIWDLFRTDESRAGS